MLIHGYDILRLVQNDSSGDIDQYYISNPAMGGGMGSVPTGATFLFAETFQNPLV